jgi:hypothetical protein
MKVLCVNIISPVTLREVPAHPGVKRLEEYDVLEMLVLPGRGAKFRILTDDGVPALFDAAMFVTTAAAIPRHWVMSAREGGLVKLGPAPWLEPGFWERYFDGDPDAIAAYESERNDGASDEGPKRG